MASGVSHQSGDRGRVLQGRARHFRRIDHARHHQVFIVAVVAEVVVRILAGLVDDDRAFGAGVGDNLAKGLFASALHDGHADLLETRLEQIS